MPNVFDIAWWDAFPDWLAIAMAAVAVLSGFLYFGLVVGT